MAQQKIVIPISPKHSKAARFAIAKEVIDHIIERTREDNKDKDGKAFPKYSSTYKKSLNFKIAGKGNRVDLTLTGEMMDSLQLLSESKGKIVIGYDKSDKDLNGKVEGNRLGTYGQSKPVAKPRDFLGIQETKLKQIEKPYLDEEKLEMKLEEFDLIDNKVDEIIGGRIIFEDLDE
jgi:hypothetical protein